MKKIALFAAIVVSFGTTACTQAASHPTMAADNQTALPFRATQPTSYLVTAKDEAGVRRVYGKYGINLLRVIGNGLFEIGLQNDPGLSDLDHAAQESNGAVQAVQPNYTYHTN